MSIKGYGIQTDCHKNLEMLGDIWRNEKQVVEFLCFLIRRCDRFFINFQVGVIQQPISSTRDVMECQAKRQQQGILYAGG